MKKEQEKIANNKQKENENYNEVKTEVMTSEIPISDLIDALNDDN